MILELKGADYHIVLVRRRNGRLLDRERELVYCQLNQVVDQILSLSISCDPRQARVVEVDGPAQVTPAVVRVGKSSEGVAVRSVEPDGGFESASCALDVALLDESVTEISEKDCQIPRRDR